MEIVVNGKTEETEEDISILEYLTEKGIAADHIVVELNKKIIKRETFQETKLSSGDRIEVLQLVGGG
jgi:thiamine biosynthesis protein ThiS